MNLISSSISQNRINGVVPQKNKRQDMASVSFSSLRSVSASTTASTTAFWTASTNASNSASTNMSTTAEFFKNPKFKKTMTIFSALSAGLLIVSTVINRKANNQNFLKYITAGCASLSMFPDKMTEIFEKNGIILLTTDNISNALSEEFNNSCKKYGITEETKPKVELEYAGKLYSIDKNGEVTSSNLPRNYDSINANGMYDSETHVIKINGNLCGDVVLVKETIAHEMYHAKEAIIKNSLPQDVRDEATKKALLNYVNKGDNISIIRYYDENTNEYKMMESPILCKPHKSKFIDFCNENLFSKDDLLGKELEEYYHLKYELKEKDRSPKQNKRLEKLSSKYQEIISSVEKLNKDGLVHKNSANSLFNKNKSTEKVLFAYVVSLENRYQYFREQEQHHAVRALTDEEISNASKYISANIQSVEGNQTFIQYQQKAENTTNISKNLIANIRKDEFNIYYNSEEEFYARKNAIKTRINEIDKAIEKINSTEDNSSFKQKHVQLKILKSQKKILKSRLSRDNLAYKIHSLKIKARNNPDNTLLGLVFDVSKILLLTV